MSRQIVITNGESSVSLMNDIEFTVELERIGKDSITASGKSVADILGYRKKLTIPAGWLSKADLSLLMSMIKSGVKLTVTYPGLSGDESGEFIFETPALRPYMYGQDGVSQWYGVTLEAISEEAL